MKTQIPVKKEAPSASPARRGADLLHDPLYNKGTAFSREERIRLGLLGLLPPRVSTFEDQVRRVMGNVRRRSTDLGKYLEMLSLLDRNETLFYRVVEENIEELMPIIYTPTVGQGCQQYAHIFRRSRGIFITRDEKGMIKDVLKNWPRPDVRVIVITDGERILGLGDLGANGMGIPVGKLSLYTACGGVPPWQTLPVMFDVGTNNETLLSDPLYLGTGKRRLDGAEFDALLEEFVTAAQEVFPKALIQFEDFANHNAFRILQKYRDRVSCFNDDIQGTAAVTLAGIYSSLRITKRKLADEKILFHGAGEAAIGIADLIVSALVAEGVSKKDAIEKCWFVDSKGLVERGRKDLAEHKRPYAHTHAPLKTLAEAVKALKPTALIGVSGQPSQFTREIVEDMGKFNERPIIFALSNPTANAECTAAEAYGWTGGRAIFASGSPFPPVKLAGRTFVPGQGNNAYIFPGVGMGAAACGASRMDNEMFFRAAKTLAAEVTQADLDTGCLFPPLTRIMEVSALIAVSTAEVAYAKGYAREPRPADLPGRIRELQYKPVYREYR